MLSYIYKFLQVSIPIMMLSFSNCNTNATSPITSTSVQQTPLVEKANREQLLEVIQEQRNITLIYPPNSIEYQQVAEQLSNSSRWLKINLLRADKVDAKQLKDGVFYLLGTPESNPYIQQLLPKLPVELGSDLISVGEQQYTNQSTIIHLSVYPNPLNESLPISILTGNLDADIIKIIQRMQEGGRWRIIGGFGYEIFENNRRVAMGNFNNQNWSVEPPTFDFSKKSEIVLTTEHFNFICDNCAVDKTSMQNFANQLEERYADMYSFFNWNSKKDTLEKLNYFLYATAESKGLMIGNTERSNLNFLDKEVHTVFNENYKEHELGEAHVYFQRKNLGQPKTLALERGLAIHFTKKWQQKGYEYWAVRLFASNNLPDLKTILSNQKFTEGSDLVLQGSAATFVDYLMSIWGKEEFLKKYKDWQPAENEILELEKGWHQYLEKLKFDYQFNIKRQPKMPFCKGFNFAHEGYRIYNGYGSGLATQSLKKMANMGVNSIAIVPYSFQRDPQKAMPIPLIQHAGNENDEAVVHSAYMAQQLGQTVMLKPQIWLGRGEWPGSIQMANKEEWRQWMKYYHDWILHYALLAEIHEMEFLCLGVEFVKATTQNPEEWRTLIKQIRGVYSGYLTYAANWGEEFQELNFWGDLDYIGLNSYYPLSKSPNPNKKELKKGFAEVEKTILEIVQKYKKPLLFTEIGFRSIEAPWQNPHAEANGAKSNEIHQKMAYEVVYESITNKDWCHGIYWWKFPSYLDYQGRDNTSFTPNNKAAEEVVRQFWGE